MKEMGNIKSNAIYNPDEIRNPPPTNMVEQERDSDLEKYIRGKNDLQNHLLVENFLTTSLQPNTSLKSSLISEGSLPQNWGPRGRGSHSCAGCRLQGLRH